MQKVPVFPFLKFVLDVLLDHASQLFRDFGQGGAAFCFGFHLADVGGVKSWSFLLFDHVFASVARMAAMLALTTSGFGAGCANDLYGR
jgi:hypothetical protein